MSHTALLVRPQIAVFLFLLAVLGCHESARAAPVDEHRAAAVQGTVEIDNVAGAIDLRGWDRPEVAVSGTIGKEVERVELTGDGNHTSIRVLLPRGGRWGSRGEGEAHLIVQVPSGSAIAATLVSSDLKVTAIRGDCKVQTVSGNIAGDVGGDVHVNSVSGNVTLAATSSKLMEVKSISGDLILTGGNAETEITTVSGSAKVKLGTVPRARFKTVSGDLTVALAAAAGAQIEGESVSGDIKLDFAAEPAADYDIQTFSGNIHNCFGPKASEAHHGPGSRLSFRTGDGRVRIATHSGDVRLCVTGEHRE